MIKTENLISRIYGSNFLDLDSIAVVSRLEEQEVHASVNEADEEHQRYAESQPYVNEGEVGHSCHGRRGCGQEGWENQQRRKSHHDAIGEVVEIKEKRNVGDYHKKHRRHVDTQNVISEQVLELCHKHQVNAGVKSAVLELKVHGRHFVLQEVRPVRWAYSVEVAYAKYRGRTDV